MTETSPDQDMTPLYIMGAIALFLFTRKRSKTEDESAETKKQRQLMIGAVIVVFLVVNNQQALQGHLQPLAPLVASNFAREFGASPTLSSVAALVAYIVVSNNAK